MRNDDFTKKLSSQLDQLARQHKDKPQVMNHVLDHIQARSTARYGWLKMSGFAVAAALAGFLVFPHSQDLSESPMTHTQNVTKLSPQMVEDLEMLMVLGEDRS